MDLGTVSLIVFGWFAAGLAMSLALGGFLRKANQASGDNHFAVVPTKHNVVTYMRGRKPANARGNTMVSQIREVGKRAIG